MATVPATSKPSTPPIRDDQWRMPDPLRERTVPLLPGRPSHPLRGERTGKNPTDRGELGTKRSLLTEAKGVPVGLTVEGANRHDKKLVEATLEGIPVERPEPTEGETAGDVPGQGL